MTRLSPEDSAAGVQASLGREDGPVWWGAADEEAMFRRWESSLDAGLALKDGSTTPYLKQWAGKMRTACERAPDPSGAEGAASFGCSSVSLPGNPAPTRPHTFCHARGGAALLNLEALVHAECLPSRQSHKCPGEYGVSERAALPELLSAAAEATASAYVLGGDGSTGADRASAPSTPDKAGGGEDVVKEWAEPRFKRAEEASLAAVGQTTFVTLVKCPATASPVGRDTFSADWWRDVVLSKGQMSTIAQPPNEMLPPQEGVVSVLVARDPADHANLFHTMTAVQSALSALHMAGVADLNRPTTWGRAKRRISVVVIDTLPQGPFDEMWSRSFSPRLGAIRPLRPKSLPVASSKAGGSGDRGGVMADKEAVRRAIKAHTASLSLSAASPLASLSGSGSDSDSTRVTHDLGIIVPARDHPLLSRVVSRPAELVVAPPAYSSTMFAYINSRAPVPNGALRSPVYRSMGLWLQQGSRHARGWRADRSGDGPEMRLAGPASPSDSESLESAGKPLCVAPTKPGDLTGTKTASDGPPCAALLPRGRVRVLVIVRRPYSRFVEHSYMSRMWKDEEQVASSIATALGIGSGSGSGTASPGEEGSEGPRLSEVEALSGRVELQFLDAAHLTWDEQMTLLAGTDVLVGVHGAALTAAALLPPWASLVEIRPKADTWFCFEYLSIRCGIEYFPLQATSNNKLPNKMGDVVQLEPQLLGSVVRRATIRAMHRRREHVLEAARAAAAVKKAP